MQDKTVRVTASVTGLRKWDVLMFNFKSQQGVVIKVKEDGGYSDATCYPYKYCKTKLGQWLWWKWLKFRVWIGIIKIK